MRENAMKRGTIVVFAMTIACARKSETVDTSHAAPAAASDPATAAPRRADTPATTSRADTTPPVTGAARAAAGDAKKTPRTREKKTDSARPTPAPASDTVRGIVAIVGTEHDKRVIVRPSGERAITLTGTDALLVGRAAGADVWVAGTRGEGNTLSVSQFAVRTVDGIAAVDGMLTAEGERLVLVTPDGQRHIIAHAPDALRKHIGGRVWISGNLDQGLAAYGVIRDKP
jgi:hypothetical protein